MSVLAGLALAVALWTDPPHLPASVVLHLACDRRTAAMGRSVRITVRATDGRGRPAAGLQVWPYLDGRRWGAQLVTDARGRATASLPLPDPGNARLQVALPPVPPKQTAWWIWAPTVADGQTVYLRRAFRISRIPRAAELIATCDDAFHAYLNGREIASGTNFQHVEHALNLQRLLRPGTNVLAVEAHNGTGPAGFLAMLRMAQSASLATDTRWEVYTQKPSGWPAPTTPGEPVHPIALAGQGVWKSSIQGWPGIAPANDFPVGLPMPRDAVCSNPVIVRVLPRRIVHHTDPNHLVGMEWEPWFTPLNVRWDTAEAVPVLGNYSSYDRRVIRQHALWMIEAGVDFLLVDWTNNLWGKQHWSERGPYVDELIRGTTAMLDEYALMKRQGIPVPKVTLLLGLDNGPQTTTTALNEEMQWVYDHYVANPKYRGLWLYYEGKPLIIPFNGGGPAVRSGQPPVDTSLFTVRWMSSQLQINHLDQQGYWSWMDGVIHPIPTWYKGSCEALTVTVAFFGEGGWTYPQARGRRGGSTYVEEFRTALQTRPRFLILCQWNEFAGQPKGEGYGPKKDQYVDCYTPELSNDIEPTVPGLPAYRGDGGWGYTYLNLTRALVDLYHQRNPADTVLAVGSPAPMQRVRSRTMEVEFCSLGSPSVRFNIRIDGKIAAVSLPGGWVKHAVDLSHLAPGKHLLQVETATPATRWAISSSQEDDPLPKPIPARVSVPFILEAARR
ncbi:MAG: hypothetical protein ACP5VE_14755 [Chthonomonadales bacterium]